MEQGFSKGQSDNLPKVDSIMVADFFANNPHFTSVEMRGVKTVSSGRENYGDAAVGYVQLRRCNKICTVKTKICPEHKVRSKNYSVIVEIDEEKEKIVEAQCQDCSASAGGCKHAVAVVMWLHRRSEEPAPTETICYWKKSRLSGVGTTLKFLTTSSFGEVKSEMSGTFTKGGFLEEFVQKGKEKNISSQIMQYYQGTEELHSLGLHQLLCQFEKQTSTTDVERFLKFAQEHMSQEACEVACKNTTEQSNSKLWYELRYGRITASKIFEAARCKTTRGVFVESVIGALKFKETEPMKRGKLLEKKVLSVLSKQLNIHFEEVGLLLSAEHVILGASPDAICENYVVEIKCPSTKKTFENYIQNNVIKNNYKAQIQLQMYIFKKSKKNILVADADFENNEKVHIIYEDLNLDFIQGIIEHAETFWKKNVFPILTSTFYKN